MPQRILDEDWSEYDNRKIRDRRDAKDFACTEDWEVDHLVSVTRKAYPQYTDLQIRAAIRHCCSTISPPHPRRAFVTCVITRLRS